jgi:hypothetical protein
MDRVESIFDLRGEEKLQLVEKPLANLNTKRPSILRAAGNGPFPSGSVLTVGGEQKKLLP